MLQTSEIEWHRIEPAVSSRSARTRLIEGQEQTLWSRGGRGAERKKFSVGRVEMSQKYKYAGKIVEGYFTRYGQ